MKLIRVARNAGVHFWPQQGELQKEPKYVTGGVVDLDNPAPVIKQAEVFLVDDTDVAVFTRMAAEQNPGVDIEVYTLEEVGHCPAGEFQAKKVSADGILPV